MAAACRFGFVQQKRSNFAFRASKNEETENNKKQYKRFSVNFSRRGQEIRNRLFFAHAVGTARNVGFCRGSKVNCQGSRVTNRVSI